MDSRTKRILLCFLPALVQPPADSSQYCSFLQSVLVSVLRPPPDPLLDIRHCLFGSDEDFYSGRSVFLLFAEHRYQFFELTGETPETFLRLIDYLRVSTARPHSLSIRNRVLLVIIWLRCYSSYHLLSALFDISVSSVRDEIQTLIPIFYLKLKQFIIWPSIEQWQSMTDAWSKLPSAVGAIDGTSHEINRPGIHQEQYYSGHRSFHAIHTQIVVDNTGRIRYVESSFPGHLNDAQQYWLMRRIGNELSFPRDSVLLGDKIYPNGYPIITPYAAPQIQRKRGIQKRQCHKLNRFIRKYRVCVEHAISEIKSYKSVGSVWRHRRGMLPRIVTICSEEKT